jgi:hypothetical protein
VGGEPLGEELDSLEDELDDGGEPLGENKTKGVNHLGKENTGEGPLGEGKDRGRTTWGRTR